MCATTLEAPELSSAATEPVEVTTCAAVETTSELMERRLYTWTAPYERGVDLVHQITDLFGIAVAGEGGTQVMGLGFPIRPSSGMPRRPAPPPGRCWKSRAQHCH
jgi:hypothetical protein